MQKNTTQVHTAEISVLPQKIERFTTLLQSGIKLQCARGTIIGIFLNDLPGFDMPYISEIIQTIFLDGNAIDDLQRPFSESNHVLALSAAMPGLAGAIFRRNSLCAALRTKETPPSETGRQNEQYCTITLKLFNSIAQEKGASILQRGGIFPGAYLKDFFINRPSLLHSISRFEVDHQTHPAENMLSCIDVDSEYFLAIDQGAEEEEQ